MAGDLKPSAERVQAALDASGVELEVREFSATTRTAADAAAAVGCRVGQMANSLVFRAPESDRAVLVIASGANRVDTARIAALLGEPIEKADAEFVRAKTGFVIGGVAPVGHEVPLPTFVDRDLMRYRELWAAAAPPMRCSG